MNLLKSILIVGFLLSLAVVASRIGAEPFDAKKPETTAATLCGCTRAKPCSYDTDLSSMKPVRLQQVDHTTTKIGILNFPLDKPVLYKENPASQTSMESSADQCNQFCDCAPNGSMPNGWTGRQSSIGRWQHCSPCTLLQWPLSGLPSDIIVTKATIKLYCDKRWGQISGHLFFAPVTGHWDSRVTYAKRPSIDASQAIEVEWPYAGKWFEVDITSIANQWSEGTLSNYGIQVYSTSTARTGGIDIRTPGWTDPQYRPKLTIIYEYTSPENEESPDLGPDPIENITVTASSSQNADVGPGNTINGSGLDANDLHSIEPTDMWLSGNEPLGAWIEYEFDKVYKLNEMLVWNSNQKIEPITGFGLKDVTIEYSTSGADYTTLGTTHEFARAPGTAGYAHNTTIDLSGVAAKYVRLMANSNWGGFMPQYGLSEVRFLHIFVNARRPCPDIGATDVAVDAVLSWRAGREADKHNVYLSTDEQAVIDGTAPVATVAEASYGPLSLDLGQAYYWRVDEVNEAETPTTWESHIWNFRTTDHIVVDDFESYNDLDPTEPLSKRIFSVWIDGYDIATNGSLVGHENPPFCERTIVHGGSQSMPFFYANTDGAAYSEAELPLSPPQDWTKAGIATLVLYFYGTAGSTGQLYVKVNGSKVVYDGDAADIARPQWKQWNIDLASVDTNLQNVAKLSIGIDGNGASGTLYFDDIRLYPPR